MCTECNRYPCATTCPNGEPVVDEIWVECPLCGNEVDEAETRYGICEACWTKYRNYDNALSYGATATESVEINGLYAKVLTPEQIDAALRQAMTDMKKFYFDFTIKAAEEFISDDDGAFAKWLKEQNDE